MTRDWLVLCANEGTKPTEEVKSTCVQRAAALGVCGSVSQQVSDLAALRTEPRPKAAQALPPRLLRLFSETLLGCLFYFNYFLSKTHCPQVTGKQEVPRGVQARDR